MKKKTRPKQHLASFGIVRIKKKSQVKYQLLSSRNTLLSKGKTRWKMNTPMESRNRRFIPPSALQCLLSQPWLSKRMLVKIFAWYSTEPLFHRPGILHWIIFNFSSGRKNRVSYTLSAWLGFIYLFNGKSTPNWGAGGTHALSLPAATLGWREQGEEVSTKMMNFSGKMKR